MQRGTLWSSGGLLAIALWVAEAGAQTLPRPYYEVRPHPYVWHQDRQYVQRHFWGGYYTPGTSAWAGWSRDRDDRWRHHHPWYYRWRHHGYYDRCERPRTQRNWSYRR